LIRLLYSGQFRDPSGYGKAALLYLKALDLFRKNHPGKLDLAINVIQYDEKSALSPADALLVSSYEFEDFEKREEWIADGPFLFIGHHLLNSLVSEASNLPYLQRAARVICMTVWETTHLPKVWTRIAKSGQVDSLIVPCAWNVDIFGDDTGLPVHLLPHVIPEAPEAERVPVVPGCFNILTVSQWIYRKGFDVLIKAYLMEFHNNPEACLVIKSYRNNTNEYERGCIKADIAQYRDEVFVDVGINSNARILFIGDLLSENEMEKLYHGADVFALATRGEGFGLPYSEAIQRGLPVICPDKGGHVDFIDLDNAYLIAGTWEPCHTLGMFYTSEMEWYEPSLFATRKALREAYQDWKAGTLQARGDACREYIAGGGYDAGSIGKRFYSILESEAIK
jgi:glycosyltransferase involved in cell wall biosynthesis